MPVTPDAARMPGGPPLVPEVPPLDNLYGAYLIGTFDSLYGLSLHQLFRYVRLHKSDTAFIRILVGFVMTLETIHVALVVHTCYFYLVTNYAHPENLIHSEWSLEITPSFTAFVSLTAQIFFARRVSLIGWRYKIVAAIAMVALLAHVAFSLAITIITATKTHNLSGFDTLHADWIFPAVGVSATLGDLLLSGSIIIAVRRSRSHHLNTQSENHFDVAVLYLINSGLLTGVFNAIPTITAAMYPQTFIWAAFSLVATRLYANTLLSVLNSRKLAISRGLEIFHATAYVHHNIIARANHLAAVERWNAPDVSEPSPAKIDISVSADVETDGPRDDKGLDGDHKRFSADSGLGLA
ncbi:hypothetical protein BD413DRAFT_617624 [Trametes elegans]|nr:hypothetical protein BD413DRAFT_617624 [Trametes elegans]